MKSTGRAPKKMNLTNIRLEVDLKIKQYEEYLSLIKRNREINDYSAMSNVNSIMKNISIELDSKINQYFKQNW